MRKRFIVELELPEEATYEDARVYIEDAVASLRGQLQPHGSLDDPEALGHPMSGLDPKSVIAFRYQRRRK